MKHSIEFTVVSDAPNIGKNSEIVALDFDLWNLRLKVGFFEGLQDIEVHYSEVIGFRALDEGDLLEFWEHFNLRDGWIFQVHKGGWFDLEATRGGFTSAYSDFLKEFLIIGEDLCISVISKDDPVFKQAQNS